MFSPYIRRRVLLLSQQQKQQWQRHQLGCAVTNRWLASSSSSDDDGERPARMYRRADSEMVIMDVDDALGSRPENQYSDLVDMLQREQLEAAKDRVPWFLENMPPAYFKQVSQELRDQHLCALVALYDFDAVPELTLNSQDGTTMTKISGGANTPGKLFKQLSKIPTNTQLNGMNIFSSLDNDISLNIFEFQGATDDTNGEKAQLTPELVAYLEALSSGTFKDDPLHAKPAEYFAKEEMEKFVAHHCSQKYLNRSSPRRFCKQIQLYHEIMKNGEDEVGIDIESGWAGNPQQTMITLGITNVLAMAAMKRISQYFSSKKLNIARTHLDLVKGPQNQDSTEVTDVNDPLKSNTVSMFRILAHPLEEKSTEELAEINHMLETDLPTVSKWIDDRALDLVVQHDLSSREAEVVIALCDLAHAILAPKDAFEYARSNIENVVTDATRIGYTKEIIDLFIRRFDPSRKHPERADGPFLERLEDIRSRIKESGELSSAQTVFSTLVDIIKGTYRTNAFTPNRFGVSFRLDPKVCTQHLLDKDRTEYPYGVFFVHGRRFAGFHVRFRDISRGGLRVVTPRNSEMHGVESARQLVECYDLAFAQQLKNKDIAEGGSKAVCLVDMAGVEPDGRDHIVRKSLKAMVNSVLDIITPNEKNEALMVDHMSGAEEFIYFGPDEQVTPEHINWIVKRAGERAYPMPSAFMSSKPDAGINHKVYGVTSEGVAVFLHEALHATGVSTDKPFTVKITGGPDGDVAGNMLKILHREYGENARVVGLADGTASLTDPDGITWSELLRMFHEVVPLSGVDQSKLGPNAEFSLCDTPEGINKRNMMHNLVEADAFVPAGGRPATINDENWQKFLKADGTPSSPLIVEGANLFLTPYAREQLSNHGVVIVKDSSANKCGVICSSFEIIASMLLSKEEFLDIKEEFVEDVLEGLRLRAQREASLMFREYKSDPDAPLPPVSERISRAINRSTDAIAEILGSMSEEELQKFLPVIRASLPKKLMDVAWDRWMEKVPTAYVHFQLACILASEIVYREGVDYAMNIKEELLAQLILSYAEKALRMNELAGKLKDDNAGLSTEERELIRQVLVQGGARTIIDHHIE